MGTAVNTHTPLHAGQLEYITYVLRQAQDDIFAHLGLDVDVEVSIIPRVSTQLTPDALVAVVATVLDVKLADIQGPSRKQPLPSIRALCAHLMAEMSITQEVAAKVLKKERTSIISMRARAKDMIYLHDAAFMPLYTQVMEQLGQYVDRHTTTNIHPNAKE